MDNKFDESLAYFLANGYLVCIKGKYRVTQKFMKQVGSKALGAVIAPDNTITTIAATDWSSRYMQFIIDARVPARLEGSYGEFYDGNKYSAKAATAFRKMMEQGVDYDILVASTGLYYRTDRRFRISISRYIEEGQWRSDYEALKMSAQEDKVLDHIKNELDDGSFSINKLG